MYFEVVETRSISLCIKREYKKKQHQNVFLTKSDKGYKDDTDLYRGWGSERNHERVHV